MNRLSCAQDIREEVTTEIQIIIKDFNSYSPFNSNEKLIRGIVVSDRIYRVDLTLFPFREHFTVITLAM